MAEERGLIICAVFSLCFRCFAGASFNLACASLSLVLGEMLLFVFYLHTLIFNFV